MTPVAPSEVSKEWLADQGMTQALLYYWDHIEAYPYHAPSPREIEMEQLFEAYWFGETVAVHFYRLDHGWQVIWCTETGTEECLDERQFIQRMDDFGKTLCIRNYLEADEDGQFHVVYTRPLKLEANLGSSKGGE
ncbi:hypothetical protein V6C32_01260 [Desulforamulus ruminis]|uniref:hypothetical protein n=1 Tax=Desulforamulus ruminis TaxID=1564 RepID=UPI00117C7360|nr:hypothetical protein [Desulforamulus ruminis]